jgi:uncharacterized protein (TIGR03435 family)
MTTWVDVAGWTLLHFLWQGTAIAGLAAASLWLLRRAGPQPRYLLACLALATMVTVPAATALMLSLEAPSAVVRSPALPVPTDAPGIDSPRDRPAAAVDQRATAALPWVVGVWGTGVLVLIGRLAHGWYGVGALRRAAMAAPPSVWAGTAAAVAARLQIRRVIRVVDSIAVDAPIVLGWLRPIVVMPVAVLTHLTPEQVTAILAHELAHIRRHDFAINLLQAIVETVLFYHPGVWWLSRRVRAERERCCDATAVAVTGDAVGYVEALTRIEAWRGGNARLALAATGGSLLDRVRHVLAADTTPPARGAAVLIAAAAVLVAVAGASTYVTAIDARAEPEPEPVAWRIVFDHPSGELTIKGFTGRDLIRFAYNVPAARVIGGPSWLDAESIDLSTHLTEDPGAAGIQEVIRELLERRLALTTRTETKEFPAYALVTSTGAGPGLAPAAPCVNVQAWLEADAARRPRDLSGRRRCGTWQGSYTTLSGTGVSMAGVADLIEEFFQQGLDHLDVFDRTGLTGEFDVAIELSPLLATAGRSRIPGVKLPGMSRLPGELTEQIGLTIEPIMHPYDVIVVAGINRPGE